MFATTTLIAVVAAFFFFVTRPATVVVVPTAEPTATVEPTATPEPEKCVLMTHGDGQETWADHGQVYTWPTSGLQERCDDGQWVYVGTMPTATPVPTSTPEPTSTPVPTANFVGPEGCKLAFFNPAWGGEVIEGLRFKIPGGVIWECQPDGNGGKLWVDPHGDL